LGLCASVCDLASARAEDAPPPLTFRVDVERADGAERVTQYEHRTGLGGDNGFNVFNLLVEAVGEQIAAGAVPPSIHRADAELWREQGK